MFVGFVGFELQKSMCLIFKIILNFRHVLILAKSPNLKRLQPMDYFYHVVQDDLI